VEINNTKAPSFENLWIKNKTTGEATFSGDRLSEYKMRTEQANATPDKMVTHFLMHLRQSEKFEWYCSETIMSSFNSFSLGFVSNSFG
jgi:hypothetical protein